MGTLLNTFDSVLLDSVIDKICSQKPLYLKRQEIDKKQVLKHKSKIIQTILDSVHDGSYEHMPVKKVTIMDGKKKRIIYKLDFIDRIIAGAIYNIISEAIESHYLENIYSYRRGRSRFHALQAFANYLENHKAKYPAAQKRGFYVLRLDVKKYGESIPVSDGTYIWPLLERIFSEDCYKVGFDKEDYKFFSKFIRPIVFEDDGIHKYNKIGIIDGSPISALLLNLYLEEVDVLLANVEEGFYARFGDDILFAHKSYNKLQKADKEFKTMLNEKLGLSVNEKKKQIIFYNGAGKNSDKDIKGSERIEFLGIDNNFDGTRELSKSKTKRFFNEISSRIDNINHSILEKKPEEKGRILCSMTNEALDISSEFQLAELINVAFVNSKKQLMMFDYFIAKKIANVLANNNSVRSFREFQYKTMRSDWGLISLAHQFRKNL